MFNFLTAMHDENRSILGFANNVKWNIAKLQRTFAINKVGKYISFNIL